MAILNDLLTNMFQQDKLKNNYKNDEKLAFNIVLPNLN